MNGINYYTVTVKDNNEKYCIKHDLTCHTEGLSNIPDRECLCVDDKKKLKNLKMIVELNL
jgi:hypothetical protein